VGDGFHSVLEFMVAEWGGWRSYAPFAVLRTVCGVGGWLRTTFQWREAGLVLSFCGLASRCAGNSELAS
jgi:hypothetical protein